MVCESCLMYQFKPTTFVSLPTELYSVSVFLELQVFHNTVNLDTGQTMRWLKISFYFLFLGLVLLFHYISP